MLCRDRLRTFMMSGTVIDGAVVISGSSCEHWCRRGYLGRHGKRSAAHITSCPVTVYADGNTYLLCTDGASHRWRCDARPLGSWGQQRRLGRLRFRRDRYAHAAAYCTRLLRETTNVMPLLRADELQFVLLSGLIDTSAKLCKC